MNANDSAKKPYTRPKLMQYGDLSQLIRANLNGIGMPDGGSDNGMNKGQFKTG